MRLEDLVKPIEECSDDELRERLSQIRVRQTAERPKATKVAEKAAKKSTRKKVKPINDLLSQLTPEQIEALLKDRGL